MRRSTSRFFKYAFLVTALFITLRIVFDNYSFYLARRSLDTELDAKKIPSLEYLKLLAKRENALALASLETRCLERNQLALFRIIDAKLAQEVRDVYEDLLDARDRLVDVVKRQGVGLINVDQTVRSISSATFNVTALKLVPLPGINRDDEKLIALQDEFENQKQSYVRRALQHENVRKALELKSVQFLDMTSIKVLEERLQRIKDEREKNSKKYVGLEELIAKYEVWTSALSDGSASSFIIDELAFRLGDEEAKSLSRVECTNLVIFFEQAEKRLIVRNAKDVTPEAFSLGKVYRAVDAYYKNWLLLYFDMPPVAQTLLVTLFIGAMGALTLNVLRLSKVGWWNEHPDPLWGEVLVSPILGALAAFGIFLIGSAGLLLTSDMRAGQSVAPLSASFIGLLGFISGLLYDQAFGRVRRFGAQFFASDDVTRAASADDLALAVTLKNNGATLGAQLVITFGLGARLAAEKEFTLLMPQDQALEKLSVSDWLRISEPGSRSAFETWFRHHHATVLVVSSQVTGSNPNATISTLAVDDGTSYPLQVVAGELSVNGIKAVTKDVTWQAGVVHILQDNL